MAAEIIPAIELQQGLHEHQRPPVAESCSKCDEGKLSYLGGDENLQPRYPGRRMTAELMLPGPFQDRGQVDGLFRGYFSSHVSGRADRPQ